MSNGQDFTQTQKEFLRDLIEAQDEKLALMGQKINEGLDKKLALMEQKIYQQLNKYESYMRDHEILRNRIESDAIFECPGSRLLDDQRFDRESHRIAPGNSLNEGPEDHVPENPYRL